MKFYRTKHDPKLDIFPVGVISESTTPTSKFDNSGGYKITTWTFKNVHSGKTRLVVVSFGRAEGELSRKGRRLGHAMLADS